MGWASFREDLLRVQSELVRVQSELDGLDKNLRQGAEVDIDQHQRVLSQLVRVCRGLLVQLDKNLELATSPEINIAARVRELEQANRSLAGQVVTWKERFTAIDERERALARRYDELEKQFTRVNSRNGRLAAQLADAEKTNKRMAKELNTTRGRR